MLPLRSWCQIVILLTGGNVVGMSRMEAIRTAAAVCVLFVFVGKYQTCVLGVGSIWSLVAS